MVPVTLIFSVRYLKIEIGLFIPLSVLGTSGSVPLGFKLFDFSRGPEGSVMLHEHVRFYVV